MGQLYLCVSFYNAGASKPTQRVLNVVLKELEPVSSSMLTERAHPCTPLYRPALLTTYLTYLETAVFTIKTIQIGSF